jgi:Uma2 family endonuclease
LGAIPLQEGHVRPFFHWRSEKATIRKAYIPYTRLRRLSPKDRETSPVAPEIVVEILSPDDRLNDVDEKRRVYFALKA